MSLEEMINFVQLSSNLLTSGQPDQSDLIAIADAGVQTVINLAMPDSDFALENEAQIVRGLGLEYIHIPVGWENPTFEDLKRFMEEMEARQDKKLLVHCALNYRVSCFVALWKILKLGIEPGEAFRHMFEIWEPKEYPIWDDFINTTLLEAGYETLFG
jgi:protein tyrosine phosphatase (PTP) superfamily phosphohydrolase (DUF442 family)